MTRNSFGHVENREASSHGSSQLATCTVRFLISSVETNAARLGYSEGGSFSHESLCHYKEYVEKS